MGLPKMCHLAQELFSAEGKRVSEVKEKLSPLS